MRQYINNDWAVLETPLSFGKDMAGYVAAQSASWYDHNSLPLDVHMPLIDAGVIRDPVLSDYCFESEWIEQRAWWFKNIFTLPDALQSHAVKTLVLESLDVHADIFLNGAYLGHHASAHYPFRRDVSEWVKPGENTLLIRLTSGLEYVDDGDLAEIDYAVCIEKYNGRPERGDKRRAFLRKPTYVYGWDWCPRIATVAIAKDAYLECHTTAVIRDLALETLCIGADNRADLRAVLAIELLDILGTADADISLSLALDGQTAAETTLRDRLLRSGINYITMDVSVTDAQLWWPNGMGEQPLYQVTATVQCRNETDTHTCRYGLRTITLDTSRTDANSRRFALCVNGQNIFCKGANWIPADSIYARVSDEKYDALIREAQEAHFNMLRVWGGGIYERDAFYDACDRYGILVWQDFMFGCATYPDHLADFNDLVSRELDYQTKRLGSRTCLALFCGNNENHSMLTGAGWQPACRDVRLRREKQYGLQTANMLAPEYIRKNCPWVPYWNSSPYGGDKPDDVQIGDVHHWHACMMNPDMAKRIEPKEYDKVQARFVSEYGYPGPCPRDSIETYFDGQPVDRHSPVWHHHNNTFEKDTVDAGIKKHYTDKALTFDEYLLYAGMTQSLMLGYSLESLRFKDFCGGALFWMFNDCWGEVGWTIVDYYLRRKIAYYSVKRAFAPVKIILRETDGRIAVIGCNDTADPIAFDLRFGYTALDGTTGQAETTPVSIPAYTRQFLTTFDRQGRDPQNGLWFADASAADGAVCPAPAILRVADYRQLTRTEPKAAIIRAEDCGQDKTIVIESKTYGHGVYLTTSADLRYSDNYFDMLPGERRTVTATGGAGMDFTLHFVGR